MVTYPNPDYVIRMLERAGGRSLALTDPQTRARCLPKDVAMAHAQFLPELDEDEGWVEAAKAEGRNECFNFFVRAGFPWDMLDLHAVEDDPQFPRICVATGNRARIAASMIDLSNEKPWRWLNSAIVAQYQDGSLYLGYADRDVTELLYDGIPPFCQSRGTAHKQSDDPYS